MTSKAARTVSATYYVAVPADSPTSGIYGIGLTSTAAVQDAYEMSNCPAPSISSDDNGIWHVSDHQTGETHSFVEEARAREEAAMLGFSPRECTERLYAYVQANGAAVGDLRYVERDGLQDLDVDQDLVEAGISETKTGLEGCTAQDDWTVENALHDAHEYVYAYCLMDEIDNEELIDALQQDRQLRFAVDIAVRDIILTEIAARANDSERPQWMTWRETAADGSLDNEDAIVAAFGACKNKDDLNEVLDRVIEDCTGNAASFDDDEALGSDGIAALADGTMLAWGREGSHGGRGTRALVIYTTAEESREILSLDRSAELNDGTAAYYAA